MFSGFLEILDRFVEGFGIGKSWHVESEIVMALPKIDLPTPEACSPRTPEYNPLNLLQGNVPGSVPLPPSREEMCLGFDTNPAQNEAPFPSPCDCGSSMISKVLDK